MPKVAQIFVEIYKTLQEFSDAFKQVMVVTVAVTYPIFTKLALGRQISVKNCYTEFHEIPTYSLVCETTSQAGVERSVVVSIKTLFLLRKERQHEFDIFVNRNWVLSRWQ